MNNLDLVVDPDLCDRPFYHFGDQFRLGLEIVSNGDLVLFGGHGVECWWAVGLDLGVEVVLRGLL